MSQQKLKKNSSLKDSSLFPKTATLMYIGAILLILFKEMLIASTPLILNIMIDGAVLGKELPDSMLLSMMSRITRIEQGFASILNLSFIILFFHIIAIFSAYLCDVLNAIATEEIVMRLRVAIHKAIMRFQAEHYFACETGDLIQRCTTNIDTIRRTFNHFFVRGVAIIFSVAYIFSIMWSQNIKMALISSISAPIILISSICFFIYIKKQNEIFYKKEAIMTQGAQECLSGMRVVKAFSAQEFEMKKFEAASYASKKANEKINISDSFFWSFLDTITFTQVLFVTFYASYLAYLGQLSVGQVVAFSQYVVMLIFPIGHLGRILSNFGSLFVSIKRIKEVLNAPQECLTFQDVLPCASNSVNFENVSFEHVSFAYPSQKGTKEVLSDVSFSINKGEMLGIIGKTGAGKTSIVYLLSRLYSQKAGSIKIGGVNIQDIPLKHLRSSLGIVLQEPFLYSKSIKENIRMARPNASDEEVIEASKKAAFHEDVMQLKDGYETIVGENGITLSGGQKQRLSIARTLLKDVPIVIFDDSLSSVDSATDAKIRHAMRDMRKDKILIVISHRLSSIMDADNIITLQDGKIIEEGKHDVLMKKAGVYKKVFDMQNLA